MATFESRTRQYQARVRARFARETVLRDLGVRLHVPKNWHYTLILKPSGTGWE